MLLSERIPWLARHSWTQAEWKPQASRPRDGKASAVDEQREGRGVDGEPETKVNEVRGSSGEEEEISNGKKDGKMKSHKATMRLRHSLILLERIAVLELNVKAEQIGPGYVELLVQSSIGPMCILQTVTPLEPLLQRVTHLMFAPPLIAPLATIVLFGETLMFERDVAVWNHKRFEQRPLLVREDRSILAYRRWYAQFYSPHSPTYQSATQSLQW